jgi:hypothetical protein
VAEKFVEFVLRSVIVKSKLRGATNIDPRPFDSFFIFSREFIDRNARVFIYYPAVKEKEPEGA